MIEEPVCLKYRNDIGVDHIMWECDYPHTDTTWPDSQAITEGVLKEAGVSQEEADLITHGNAERVFNWKIAAAPGPAPAALVP
jgi:predicted TIM-barrel fold metal-dependent hydrolase